MCPPQQRQLRLRQQGQLWLKLQVQPWLMCLLQQRQLRLRQQGQSWLQQQGPPWLRSPPLVSSLQKLQWCPLQPCCPPQRRAPLRLEVQPWWWLLPLWRR
jgi:hypothetical protein